MKKEYSFIRRATKAEYPLIKNTAKELARRFETQSNWIEVVLFNTIDSSEDLLKNFKEHKDISNKIINDDDLDRLFFPSLISALSCLGAKKAKMLFGVSSNDFYENNISGDDVEKLDDRLLKKEEKKVLNSLLLDSFKFVQAFNYFPPPLLDVDADTPDGGIQDVSSIFDKLENFKKHLFKYENHFVFDALTNRIPPYIDYPWFDQAFATSAIVPEVVLERGQLAERGKNRIRFFKDENERRKVEAAELIGLVFKGQDYKPSKNYTPYVWIDASKDLIDPEYIKKVEERDLTLRKKLFSVRLFLVNELQRFFTGDSSKEPYDALIDYIKAEFSISEYLAIAELNPEFFGFASGQKYSYYSGKSLLQLLLQTSLKLPFAFESRIALQYYKAAIPIYEFSQDVDGAHLLSFGYFESYALLSSPTRFQKLCDSLVSAKKRHSAIVKRSLVNLDSFFNSGLNRKRYAQSEITANMVYGEFKDDYTGYKPTNKKIEQLTFTPKQAEVIKILMDKQDRKATVSQLVKELYPSNEAKEILNKMAKAKSGKPKFRNQYRYEWRLEKGILKSNHPAWKIGMIKIGKKKGSEKWYYLDFSFEEIK